ncbi:hypothetical protein [Apibacter sp. wkB309]|uniref:hypothetical protein n=1 Tax=Apibacter sp. wkB309 TaxID=1679467 RepID=UPI000CF9B645|nr:hypothetical protein [Apibacter sp. wkB309]PQL90933.1 hypothetical protein C4S75_05550 [Apibacter sp. wkB309]
MNNKDIIIKTITVAKNLSDFISVPKTVNKITDKEDMPIHAIRIIFYMINKLRNKQFMADRSPQIKIQFEEDFLTVHNTYAEFSLQYKDINYNSRNTYEIRKSLEYLTKHLYGWKTATNSKGEEIKTLGGFIVSPSFGKGKATFLISSYWLQQLLDLDLNYNKSLYNIVFKLSSTKQVQFYLWLMTVKTYTACYIDSLNERFKLNYKSNRDICNHFLKPIKNKLDKISITSFNYSYKGNSKIEIIIYNTKLQEIELDDSTNDKILKIYKLSYIKKRHRLNDTDILPLKNIFYNDRKNDLQLVYIGYDMMVINCRKNKIKMTSYVGQVFLNHLQKYVEEAYLNTTTGKKYPKLYPRLY